MQNACYLLSITNLETVFIELKLKRQNIYYFPLFSYFLYVTLFSKTNKNISKNG